MTHLREEMYDAYTSVHLDVQRLASDAQREGGRRRRRSRGLAALGSTFAVLAAVGLGTWTTTTVVGGPLTVREGSSASGTAATTPLTGVEALTATLAWVVPNGVVLEPSTMNYEPDRDGSPNARGGVEFAPSAGAATGNVTVSYAPAKAGDVERYAQCHDNLDDCDVVTLADGSPVLTYAVRRSTRPWDEGPDTLFAAQRVVNGNVVSVAADSPDVHSGAGPDDPVLTKDQLVDVIGQPEWSRLLPVP